VPFSEVPGLHRNVFFVGSPWLKQERLTREMRIVWLFPFFDRQIFLRSPGTVVNYLNQHFNPSIFSPCC